MQRIFLFSILMLLFVTFSIDAVPIDQSEFDSAAILFDFSSTNSNDFVISGGWFVTGAYQTWHTINIDFNEAISAVGVDVTRTKGQNIGMALFDTNNTLLEEYTWSERAPFFMGLDYGTNDIMRVSIFNNSDDLDIDNLIYQRQTQADPVPEPATMLLLGSGLISIVGFKRKFKKS